MTAPSWPHLVTLPPDFRTLWQREDESAFAGGIYVVFLGNVGHDKTLTQVYRAFSSSCE